MIRAFAAHRILGRAFSALELSLSNALPTTYVYLLLSIDGLPNQINSIRLTISEAILRKLVCITVSVRDS